MALKACRHCTKDIDATESVCPLCSKSFPHGVSRIVKFGGGFIAAMVALPVVFGIVSLLSPKREAGRASASEAPQAEVAPEPPKPPQPTPGELVLQRDTFWNALAFAGPEMSDTVDDGPSLGAYLAAHWLSAKGRWSDVEIMADETSLKKVKKDILLERKKRMCVTGRLIQIARDQAVPALFHGNLITGGSVVNFLAARSTGELVDGDRARFCGVVTGLYAFSNVSGGQTKSVQMAGMFDLPANRAR